MEIPIYAKNKKGLSNRIKQLKAQNINTITHNGIKRRNNIFSFFYQSRKMTKTYNNILIIIIYVA